MRSQANLIVRALSVADIVLLAVALASMWTPTQVDWLQLLSLLLVLPFWAFLLNFFGIYESQRLERIAGMVRKIASAQLAGAVTVVTVLLIIGQAHRIRDFLLFVLLGMLALMLERIALYLLLRALRSHGFDSRDVCVIGSWEAAERSQDRFLSHPEWGLRVSCVGVGAPEVRRYVHYPTGEAISESLEDVLRLQVVDEVLIVLPLEELPREKAAVALCEAHGVLGRVMLQGSAPTMRQAQLQLFTGEGTLTVGMVPGDQPSAIWKRVIDIVLGTACVIVLSPVFLISALLVKLSSPGPMVFKQRRAGLHGRPFTLYKFRTMVDGAEGMLRAVAHRSVTRGPAFKDRSDIRVTPFGRIMRRFSLDELPQLFNVIAGHMSLVGPRPLPVHEAALISGVHRRRFSMRPGITCLWQVNGRSDLEFSEWMRYDIQYVDSWSIWLDAKLLVRTIPVVVSGKGAY